MKFSLAFVAALLSASSAVAAPAPEAEVASMMAATPQWTIKALKRVCDKPNTTCTWTFGIDAHKGAVTNCKYVVKGAKASQKNGGPSKCGDYTITSGWSGQFGPGQGFTVLSVANKNRQIIYPGYTDKQVASGKVVKPDQSYAPQALPK
ncbi:hypothetical protein FSARC_13929 [Fusarium sarcochroum]|uniref:Small secreted protein n=1 Tax=Fusarium sarcochroum TaxID=1208366 RepID=A0A8H4WRH2_9HYPO|nr:hypothetical protein FSARC_13929 [Fusarium sarcochroum]